MERRKLIQNLLSAAVFGGLALLVGCSKGEKTARFGNQEKLWQMTTGQVKSEEPVDLAYAKETPALYRDASMGKADPSFIPKVTGG